MIPASLFGVALTITMNRIVVSPGLEIGGRPPPAGSCAG
jgi:hypothetical protein